MLNLQSFLLANLVYIYELTEVILVCNNKNLVFATLQVVMPSFKSFKDSQEFLVISFIAGFGKDYLQRKKNYRISLTNFGLKKSKILMSHLIGGILIQSYLTKNSTNSISESIYLDMNITFHIKMIKNQSFNKRLLQVDESFFSLESKKIHLEKFSFYKI